MKDETILSIIKLETRKTPAFVFATQFAYYQTLYSNFNFAHIAFKAIQLNFYPLLIVLNNSINVNKTMDESQL